MSDHLAALRLFARVARLGSFSAAGREAGVPQSTVSRTIAALEERVGARLLVRTTRAVAVTDAGAVFLGRLEQALDTLDEAENAVRGDQELRGTLRVATGSSFGVREVIPRLPDLMRRHPHLRIDLALEDRRQDLVAEGVDVALRFGPLPDSTATARLICVLPRIFVASPAYLAQAGRPSSPADLAGHAVIIGPGNTAAPALFRRGEETMSARFDGRLRIRASEGAVAAAAAGLGIVIATPAACRRELETGALVKLCEDWDLGSVELHAVFPAGRSAKRAGHILVDELARHLRDL